MPHDPTPQPGTTPLSPADAQALDAALGALSLRADADRAQRIAAVLSLLDRWPVEDPGPEVIESLLRRLETVRQTSTAPGALCAADAAVLDALLAARPEATDHCPLPAGGRERATALAGVFTLLDRWEPDAAPAGLADRTMHRVRAARDRAVVARLPLDPPDAERGWSIGLRQIGSVAALVLISMSLLVPVLSKARADAQVASCKSNLMNAGSGLHAYADDNRGAMPHNQPAPPVFSQLMRFAEDADGQSLPSSAVHMLVLPREGYLREEQLACPSVHPDFAGDGLYSAQAIAGSRALRLTSLDGPVMADTNPLYRREGGLIIRQAGLDTDASFNHNQAGQNVLFVDGSVMWTLRPTVQHAGYVDNFWVRSTLPPTPDRNASTPIDAFLTP